MDSPSAPSSRNLMDLYTLDQFLYRVLSHRRLFVGIVSGSVVLVALFTLLSHRDYTSKGSFVVSGTARGSALQGLASQFGVDLGSADAAQSPYFYADLLVSDRLLSQVLRTRFPTRPTAEHGDSVLLLDHLVPSEGGETPGQQERRVATALPKMRKALRSSTGPATGVVTLASTFDDPILAQAVARRAIELANQFNVESRQTQAGARRQFLEAQVADMSASLREAEDSLQAFLLRNRDYRNSPMLNFDYERLQRTVTIRQGAYTQVFQSYLQAQASEVQNTPVITSVGDPMVPALPDPRRLLMRMLAAAVASFVLVVTWLAVRDTGAQVIGENPRLGAVATETLADARALFGRARHPVRGSRTRVDP